MNMSDWQFHTQVVLTDEFRFICKQFEFSNKNRKSLILCTLNCYVELNFETGKHKTLVEFRN